MGLYVEKRERKEKKRKKERSNKAKRLCKKVIRVRDKAMAEHGIRAGPGRFIRTKTRRFEKVITLGFRDSKRPMLLL